MKTILLTLLLAFSLVSATTAAQASWRPTSDADCANMSTQVNLCYLACAKQRPLGVGLILLLEVYDTPMVLKAITLRAQNAICAGWAYDGGACRTINVLLQRFCRPTDPSTGYWVLKPIYRTRS